MFGSTECSCQHDVIKLDVHMLPNDGCGCVALGQKYLQRVTLLSLVLVTRTRELLIGKVAGILQFLQCKIMQVQIGRAFGIVKLGK